MPKNTYKDKNQSSNTVAHTINKLKEVWASAMFFLVVFFFLSLITCNGTDLSGYNTAIQDQVLHNFFGMLGAWTALNLFRILGLASFVIPLFLFLWALRTFFTGFSFGWIRCYLKTILFGLALISASILLTLYETALPQQIRNLNPDPYAGGIIGYFIVDKYATLYLGVQGSRVIFAFLFIISSLLLSEGRPLKYIKWFITRFILLSNVLYSTIRAWIEFSKTPSRKKQRDISRKRPNKKYVQPPTLPVTQTLNHTASIHIEPQIEQAEESNKFNPTSSGDINSTYELPSIELLDEVKRPKTSAIEASLKQRAVTLQQTLAEFGIEVAISDITRGPVITRYELTLAPGTKVQRITALSDDIALAMKTPHIRIIAPIPGKAAVGIEVPNEIKTLVTLRDLLCSKEFINTKAVLPLVLGKDIAGRPIITDLNAAPHLLIAGATGSGKSVCINSFIVSLLYNASPSKLKFLMVDPKKVELTQYNKLPHLLAPVITDPKKVSAGLNWIVNEMDHRYQLLAEAGVRNIKSFNKLPSEKRLQFYNEKSFDNGYMPYIVVILDELADLMMVAQDDIENAIARLAQLSRAVGIHLILATQRPSVNVITGVIKANFPVRISFKVSSKVDSRTILDSNGSESLLGNGDFLFLPPGTSKLIRGQGAFLTDKEIRKVVDSIHEQTTIPKDPIDIFKQADTLATQADVMDDELYERAVEIITMTGQASSSILQRKLRVGYARAARLIDMMETNGIVGPHRGSKPREILIE